jgi:tetratricopeptide (TPR) repeat protein
VKGEEAAKRSYSRQEVCRLAGISPRQLKSWQEQGFIRPAESFDFSDLIAVRTLVELKSAGISSRRIRSSLVALRRRLHEVSDPLRELKVFTDGKRIGVQVAGRRMEPVTGQLLLDFESDYLKKLLTFSQAGAERDAAEKRQREAETWFARGLQLEQMGAPPEQAIEAYKNAIAAEPASAGALVNLGTIYFRQRKLKLAERYYRRAVEADPKYALARFNLGNVFDERSEWDAAREQYAAAVALDPSYADAHYNLALVYRHLGQNLLAMKHWQIYLTLDPASQWAVIARRELDALRRAAIVTAQSAPSVS